ncbi:hypothetical protein N9Z53_00920 [Mariniblastus sp.]|nr:hypothetical protein [Mariniblastus sp.]
MKTERTDGLNCEIETVELGGENFQITRPHDFGIVINRAAELHSCDDDYLHQVLLRKDVRDQFLDIVDEEGLVVCKHVRSAEPTYRKVRGKSSYGKLSQAEYYHHDGCSCPVKPRVVEVRMPHQLVTRNIATAIAPFRSVLVAMLRALPKEILVHGELQPTLDQFSRSAAEHPPVENWDRIQGRITRLVRRELDAESCRAYFRRVDEQANAYVEPWEMGESRLICNNHKNLDETMQHRRSYQTPKTSTEANGSLVKRWTAEEL